MGAAAGLIARKRDKAKGKRLVETLGEGGVEIYAKSRPFAFALLLPMAFFCLRHTIYNSKNKMLVFIPSLYIKIIVKKKIIAN